LRTDTIKDPEILGKIQDKISVLVDDNKKRSGLLVDATTNFDWIGIDLGCTHTSAAYSKKGISNRIAGIVVDMIPISNENGRTSVPSVVRISENGDPPQVGNSALRG